WNDIVSGECVDKPPIEQGDPSPGASIYVPLTLQAHERQTIRLLLTWYVPDSNLTIGVPEEHARHLKSRYYKPWYAGRFADITEVTAYWLRDYDRLREETERFTNTLYGTTMPAEIVQAVTSNLTIFKSPTILRQTDGRL